MKQETDSNGARSRGSVLSNTSMQTKGDLSSRSNNCEFAFPEGPFWTMLCELSITLFVCFPLFFLTIIIFAHLNFPSPGFEYDHTTSQVFNCSNLMQFPGCPYSKVDLTQPCIFKGPFNSNYRPDEWDFIFQSSQVSSIQKCQILPSCAIQLRVLHFVQMLATKQERDEKTHFLRSEQSLGPMFV